MSAKKRTRLTNLRLRRVDLVDAGDNPGAEILLAKAKERPVKKGGPLTLGEVVNQNEVGKALSDLYNALCAAVWNNLYGDGTPEAKAANIKTSIAQFAAALTAEVDEEYAEDAAGVMELGDDEGAALTVDTAQKLADTALGQALRVVRKIAGQSLHVPAIDPAFEGKDKKMAKSIEDLQKDYDALQKKYDEAMATHKKRDGEAVTAEARVTELEKQLKDATETPEAIEKRKLDALPADVRKQMDEDRAEIKKLRDAGELVDFEKQAAALDVPGTTPAKFAPILRDITKHLKPEDVTEVKRILASVSEIAKRGGAFRSAGSPGQLPQGDGSAIVELQKRINEAQSKDSKLTFEAAHNQVMKDADLAERVQKERSAAS